MKKFDAVTTLRVKPKQMTILLGSFATMLDAGVPIYRALDHLGRNAETPEACMLCQALTLDVGRGQSLSRAASRYPRCFSPLQVGMLRVGEETGELDGILKRMASFEEKNQANAAKVRSALTYPLVLLTVCLFGLALAPPFLLEPQFALIRDLKAEIPWVTRWLMTFSSWMRSPIPYLVLMALAVAVPRWVIPYLSRPHVRLRLTRWALRVPKVGKLVRGLLTTRFARALGMQLQAGVPVQNAVFLAGRVAGDPYLEKIADELIGSLTRGRPLSKALRESEFFSPMFISVVMVGEETGDVAKLVEWLADMGDEDIERSLDTVSAMLEPLVMAGMGIVVGVMVIATLLPLSKALESI